MEYTDNYKTVGVRNLSREAKALRAADPACSSCSNPSFILARLHGE
jgi:hypothetical protein